MHKNKFVDIHELNEYYNQKSEGEVLLDVRTDEEFREGHIPDSVHIPLDQLENRYTELKDYKKIYIYCRKGRRAASAFEILQEKGVDNLFCCNGGGMDEWREANYPEKK